MQRSCTNCTSKSDKSWLNKSSWLSALFVIVIPKCPFCIMAYTSAITICGGSDMYFTENNWVSFIPVIMAAAIILFIMLNHRGKRTSYAMTIAFVGFSLILLTHQIILPEVYYNVGTGLLMIAIWLNGSFLSFITTIEGRLFRKLNLWPR